MLERHAVTPFAYGPGSTDILVTFIDPETKEQKNQPIHAQEALHGMYEQINRNIEIIQKRYQEDAEAVADAKMAAIAEATELHKKVLAEIENKYILDGQSAVEAYNSALALISKRRAEVDDQAFAIAEKALGAANGPV